VIRDSWRPRSIALLGGINRFRLIFPTEDLVAAHPCTTMPPHPCSLEGSRREAIDTRRLWFSDSWRSCSIALLGGIGRGSKIFPTETLVAAPRTPRRTCCPYAYVLITVLNVSRSCELFPDGFDLHSAQSLSSA